MMSDAIYRVMPPNLRSRAVGGSPGYQYKLGEWTPRIKNPIYCKSGYHTLTADGILQYAKEGDVLVRCLRRGGGGVYDGKATNESVKPVEILGTLTREMLLLHAADCVEDALPHYARAFPDDPTLEIVTYMLRAFALGGVSREELAASYAASYAAAHDAAHDAANAAAHDAAHAAYAASYAAADAAAHAAAYAAAHDAANAAAHDAAHAAYAAADAAADAAAHDAANAAAHDAAYAAACAAARQRYGKMLVTRVKEATDE